jgi:hypothetical protein
MFQLKRDAIQRQIQRLRKMLEIATEAMTAATRSVRFKSLCADIRITS